MKEEKVDKTCTFSEASLLQMASDLHEKFHKPTCVTVKAWHFSEGVDNALRPEYSIYIQGIFMETYDSMSAALSIYHRLLKGDVPPSSEDQDDQS